MSDRIPTFEEMVARRDESIAHDFAEWFFKAYAPADEIDKARFHADLFTLVRRIYAEAQAPLIKQMSAAMSLAFTPNSLGLTESFRQLQPNVAAAAVLLERSKSRSAAAERMRRKRERDRAAKRGEP